MKIKLRAWIGRVINKRAVYSQVIKLSAFRTHELALEGVNLLICYHV